MTLGVPPRERLRKRVRHVHGTHRKPPPVDVGFDADAN
jgi:hypothetical protein